MMMLPAGSSPFIRAYIMMRVPKAWDLCCIGAFLVLCFPPGCHLIGGMLACIKSDTIVWVFPGFVGFLNV